MGRTIMGAAVSLDGFIADDHDGVGPLFDWYGNGDVGWSLSGNGDECRTTQQTADFMLAQYPDIAVVVIGRRLFDLMNGCGSSRRPAVHATVNGYNYRSTVACRGGAFMLPVSAEVRAHAGVAAGDEVEVVFRLETEPRTVVVPPDLAAALDAEPGARRAFDNRSYSRQLRDVVAVEAARTPTTRQRHRIESTLAALRSERTTHDAHT